MIQAITKRLRSRVTVYLLQDEAYIGQIPSSKTRGGVDIAHVNLYNSPVHTTCSLITTYKSTACTLCGTARPEVTGEFRQEPKGGESDDHLKHTPSRGGGYSRSKGARLGSRVFAQESEGSESARLCSVKGSVKSSRLRSKAALAHPLGSKRKWAIRFIRSRTSLPASSVPIFISMREGIGRHSVRKVSWSFSEVSFDHSRLGQLMSLQKRT